MLGEIPKDKVDDVCCAGRGRRRLTNDLKKKPLDTAWPCPSRARGFIAKEKQSKKNQTGKMRKRTQANIMQTGIVKIQAITILPTIPHFKA